MTFWSSDPYSSLLKSFGYNAVRLPRANIKPLQVLSKTGGDLTYLGELSTVFSLPNGAGGQHGPNGQLPDVESAIAPNISGQKTDDLSVGFGLAILEGILSAMGSSSIGLAGKYKQAKAISFQYEDVYEDRIQWAQLDQFLSQADINPSAPTVSELLESDAVYIITSTIRSKKFTIRPKTSKEAEFKPNIPEIQGIVGGKISVTANPSSSAVVTFEGPTSLVFGFQCVQLFYDRNKYTRSMPAKSNKVLRGLKSTISDSPFTRIRGL